MALASNRYDMIRILIHKKNANVQTPIKAARLKILNTGTTIMEVFFIPLAVTIIGGVIVELIKRHF